MKQTLVTYFMLVIPVSFACLFISCNSGDKKESPHKKETPAIAYPQPQPDSSAISFLPGIVSTDSADFNAAFSPGGREFYFSRVIDGVSKIFFTSFDGNTWDKTVKQFSGSDQWADADPVWGPDDKLYFISNRPTSSTDILPDYNIWYASFNKEPGGGWATPQNFEQLNSDSNEFYISFARNGNIYFSSSRAGGYGQEDIYVSKLENGKYSAPENLGSTINTDKSEYDPGISPDEKMLWFASSKRADSYGQADLYCAIATDKMLWTQIIHPGTSINTNTRDYCPYFSPDGKYFFFTSNKDVKWMSVQALKSAVDKHK